MRRRNREQLFDFRWKQRERRRAKKQKIGASSSSVYRRPTIFRRTIASSDDLETAAGSHEIPRPKDEAASVAAAEAEAARARPRRRALDEDYRGGEAPVLNANRHNDFTFEDLVNIVHITGDTCFAFNRTLAKRVIELLADDERGEISVDRIVSVARLARDNSRAAKGEDVSRGGGGGRYGGGGGGGDDDDDGSGGGGSGGGGAGSKDAEALALVERSNDPSIMFLFLGHKENRTAMEVIVAAAAANTAAVIADAKMAVKHRPGRAWREGRTKKPRETIERMHEGGAIKAAEDAQEAKLQRAEEEKVEAMLEQQWTDEETKRVQETIPAMLGVQRRKAAPPVAISAAELYGWMAQQRARRLAWLKVRSLMADTRYFGKGVEKHGERRRCERMRTAQGIGAAGVADGAALRTQDDETAGCVGIIAWGRAILERECGVGWFEDYIYFIKNFHPLAACFAASKFHPRSHIELFQILCIDINFCILLTAVSVSFQVNKKNYDSHADVVWTATWSDFVIVTLPQVRLKSRSGD